MSTLLQRLQRLFGRKPPKRLWVQAKFSQRYTHSPGTYGIPQVHGWSEGATLKIGAYSSLAGNMQIYLGGHHRTD